MENQPDHASGQLVVNRQWSTASGQPWQPPVVNPVVNPVINPVVNPVVNRDQFAFRPTGSTTCALINLNHILADILQTHP